MATTSVKYWSSSPRTVTPSGVVASPQHFVLMTAKVGTGPEKTIQIAKCLSGAVSARIAVALDKFEKGLNE
jgi:hypothetical protein